MILTATFSKPAKNCANLLGRDYIRIRFWRSTRSALKPNAQYDAEFFTAKQSFRKTLSTVEFEEFVKTHAGTTFKNVTQKTETEEITILSNRHGEIKTLRKPLKDNSFQNKSVLSENRKKNYIIKEDIPVAFLVRLGVMNTDGKVLAQKYDKFRQINRFLEFIDNIIDSVTSLCTDGTFTKERPLHIADFGCGKSYLTFAVYHFLTEIKKIPVEITGLDLKEDVITDCQKLARDCGYSGLNFYVGDVANFTYTHEPDMLITLHACDTATDYAISYAVSHGAKAILSVPCCQHEINTQLDTKAKCIPPQSPLASLSRYGIIRERMAALATDAIRAELLEQKGYNVQVMEFIDAAHTPKNLLIRAVKKTQATDSSQTEQSRTRVNSLLSEMKVSQTLNNIFTKCTSQ